MHDPARRNMCHRECHRRALKRVCGGAVAAHLASISVSCVNIRTQGQPDDFSHSLLVNPSDTIGAVKTKFLSVIGCQSWSHLLDFYFAGQRLPDHLSLAECGVAPNDTIDMTFDIGRQQLFVQRLFHKQGNPKKYTVMAQPSEKVSFFLIKLWLCSGVLPQSSMLICCGKSISDVGEPWTLADYYVRNESTLHLVCRKH